MRDFLHAIVGRKVLLVLTLAVPAACQTPDILTTVIEQYSDPLHGWRRMDGKVPPNPVNADARSLANGGEKFQSFCVPCHGRGGKGDGAYGQGLAKKPANLQEAAAIKPDHHLFLQIKHGLEDMPRWKEALGERDRWDIVNYINFLSKSPGP